MQPTRPWQGCGGPGMEATVVGAHYLSECLALIREVKQVFEFPLSNFQLLPPELDPKRLTKHHKEIINDI